MKQLFFEMYNFKLYIYGILCEDEQDEHTDLQIQRQTGTQTDGKVHIFTSRHFLTVVKSFPKAFKTYKSIQNRISII